MIVVAVAALPPRVSKMANACIQVGWILTWATFVGCVQVVTTHEDASSPSDLREPCEADQRAEMGACIACPAGSVSEAGGDLRGKDTVCEPVLCTQDQHVLEHACVPCAQGTVRRAGDDATRDDTRCDELLCETDQRVAHHTCVPCELGLTNRAGDHASGDDTACDGSLCSSNEHVMDGECTPCPLGTAREAGDDPLREDTACAAVVCDADQRVLDHACVACPPGTTTPSGADSAGADTACTAIVCEADFHVVDHRCVACAAGGLGNRAGDDASRENTSCDGDQCPTNYRVNAGHCVPCAEGSTNEAGDNALGGDTSCDAIACEGDQHVVDHACAACPLGTTNEAGDLATGTNTSCDAIVCGQDQRVSSNACVACPPGTTRLAGDDATGPDTACSAVLCEADQRVLDHACVTCPGSSTNDAGDDASGSDTTCDTCCSDGNCLCHGPEPVALVSTAGPYATESYDIPGEGCVFYPTDARPPLAAIALADGYTGIGGCGVSQVAAWGPFYASWGIVAMVVVTQGGDGASVRAEKLLDGVQVLKDENGNDDSPLFGKLAGRFATSGYSSGGGASTIASSQDPSLYASVAVMPSDSATDGITVPTLVICGASDAVNTCNVHGQPTYDGISNSVDKVIVVISSGADGSPSAGSGASGRYALAFMKLFLEGDERWRAPLLAAPNDGTTLQ